MKQSLWNGMRNGMNWKTLKVAIALGMGLGSLWGSWGLGTSAAAWAGETPYARHCRILEGQFWVIWFDESKYEDHPLCILEEAVIGAESLFNYHLLKSTPESLTAYLNSQATRVLPATQPVTPRPRPAEAFCREWGAVLKAGIDSDGMGHLICRFSDGSDFGVGTLARGFGHRQNAKLDQALRISFPND